MRVSVLALAVVLLAGCSNLLEARDAKALLERAEAEQAKLASAAFEVRLDVAAGGEKYSFALDGAAQLKGRNAGDQFVRVRATGKGADELRMSFAKRGRRVTTSFGGTTQSFEAGEPGAPDVASLPSFGSIDFASCVERLDVAAGRQLNGEPATRIAGVVDTECILRAAAKLGGAAESAGQSFDFGEVAKRIQDVRATLFVSERSQLLIGAVIRTRIDAEGNSAELQLSYRLTNVNRPIRFPAGM